jgi:Tfp pilus assembly protein PilN
MRTDFSTRRRLSRLRPLDLLLIALAVTVLCWSSLSALAARRELAEARLAVRQLREHGLAEERRLRELEQVRRDRDDALARQAFQTLASPPALILADIEPTLPADARLEGLTLAYDHETVDIELQLRARTPHTYDAFVQRMERSDRFGNLAFGSENRSGDMKVTLRASYRARGDS